MKLKEQKQVAAKPKKVESELHFTSGTLKKELETFLNSRAQLELAVKAAVEQGYNEKWVKEVLGGKAGDGDKLALAIGALIRQIR